MTRLGHRHSHLTILVGFVAAACAYIFFLEPWGHDTWYHLQRLLDIQGQFQHGTLRAHFAENAAGGKGLPVWIYYSQWIYWPPMLLDSLGAGPLISLKVIYCGFLIVCCVGCYRLLKLHADEGPAVLGTLLFVTSNYVVGEIFQRSAYAEYLSVALLPFLLFAMNRVLRHGGKGAMLTLVLTASLMILSHPLSFMNAGYALAAYAAYVMLCWRLPAIRLVHLCVLFLLALGLTAFYWLPAVIETRYVLGAEGVPTPLQDTFLTIPGYFRFHSILSLGFVLTGYAIAVFGSLLLRRADRDAQVLRTSWPLVVAILVYVYLTLRLSEPVYMSVPLLASNLWVWRVLFPMTLLVVLFIVGNFRSLPRSLRSDTVVNAVAVLAVLQATAFVLFYTASDVSVRRLEIAEIQDALADETQRLEGFGIDEYLPQPRALPKPDAECPSVRAVAPNGLYQMRFTVEAGDANACIHLPRYWNTRYQASIDGEEIPVYADSDGEILVAPEGRSGTVTVRFGRPAYVRLSDYLSGTAAVMALVTLAWPCLAGIVRKNMPDAT